MVETARKALRAAHAQVTYAQSWEGSKALPDGKMLRYEAAFPELVHGVKNVIHDGKIP